MTTVHCLACYKINRKLECKEDKIKIKIEFRARHYHFGRKSNVAQVL